MQRGKASVQHYESGGHELLKALDRRTHEAVSHMKREQTTKFTGTNNNNEAASEREGEMAGHIVDQLRRAYDELLHEPLPDHLRQLLANLSEGEDKS
jgi:hypothetical protein